MKSECHNEVLLLNLIKKQNNTKQSLQSDLKLRTDAKSVCLKMERVTTCMHTMKRKRTERQVTGNKISSKN